MVALFFLSFVVLYAAFKFKISFTQTSSKYFPRPVSLFVSLFYGCLCIYSIIILDKTLDISLLFDQLLNDQLLYLLNQPKVGVELANSGVLKFFFIAQMSFVLIFFALNIYQKSMLVKLLCFFLIIFLLVFFFLVSRREVIIFALLIGLLGFLDKRPIGSAVKFIVPVFGFMIIMVNLRLGSENVLDLTGFLRSQEFYPFQFGAILIDRWISSFYLEDVSYLIPVSIFFDDFEFTTLSQKSMSDVYSHLGPGPTVSINYTLVAFLFAPLIVYLAAISAIMHYIYHKCLTSKRSYLYVPYYAFLSIKLLLFLANNYLR